MTDLSTLTLRLEAETSQYQQQLSAATKQLQAFQTNVTEVVEDLVKKFAALFTIDKIAEFVDGAVESAAAMERLSQESGVAVEQLSALAAVFAQSGVGQDAMATSLKKLNTAISDAAGNATSKAAFAFQALGISVTNSNGSIKTAGQLLPEIADAYSHLADGANKVAINTDLFGKSANALIPALNNGRQGLEDLEAAAIASGAALSHELAAAAEALEGKFNDLKKSAVGTFSTETLEAALPALNALADGLAAVAKEGSASKALFEALTAAIKGAGAIVLEIQGEFKQLGSAMDGIENAGKAAAHGISNIVEAASHFDGRGLLAAITSTGDNVSKILNDQSDEAEAIFKARQDALDNLTQAGGDKQVQITEKSARAAATALVKEFDDVLSKASGVSPALEQALSAGQKKIEEFAASLKVQVDSFDKGAAAQTALKLSTGELGDAVALAQKKYDDLTAQGVNPYTESAIKAAKATLDAASAAQKLSVQQQAQIDTKSISNYTDKLQEEIDRLTLGSLAAVAYATAHGKLGLALRDTAIDGAAATANIIGLEAQLVKAGNEKSLNELNVQALELSGHLVAAADAAFAFQSKLQKANAGSVGDAALQQAIDDAHARTDAEKAFQEEVNKTAQIRAYEALAESAVNAAVASGQMSELAGQQQINAARLAELASLGDVDAKMQKIADGSGIPALVLQAKQAQASLNDLAASTNALANKLRDDFENSASDAFASFVTGTETASQAAHQFLTGLENELVKLATKNLLEQIIPGGGNGGGSIFTALAGLLGGGAGNGLSAADNAAINATASSSTDDALRALGGGLASGGPAMAGTSYTVGEHGAEEFVPSVNGTIVPNSKMNRGTVQNFNFTIAAPAGTVSRATQAQIGAAAASGVNRANKRSL